MISSFLHSTRRPVVSGATILLLVVVVVGVWWHCRDFLRDLLDYTALISAAGKLEAGLKPYTDVRSPMQTATYILNYLTEVVFGRSYLGLTWGGLIQALGGALLVRAMLLARFSPLPATLVALAVTLAGPLQHSLFFFNPIGILCFAVVVLGFALEPEFRPLRSWRSAAVAAALFLGGTNKINFQAASLGIAGLLSLSAWTSGRISGAVLGRNAAVAAACGLVLPLAFELVWTGASPALWFENVVLLPAGRHEVMAMMWSPAIYLQPPRDFHHHLLLRPLGGVGLLVLLLSSAWLAHDAWRRQRSVGDWIARALLVLAVAGAGALLMVTNNESVVLTSLAYPVAALAILLNFSRPEDPGNGRLVGSFAVASLVWLIVGGYAAWHGSRVLYGGNPPERSAYVRFHSTERALAYFDGVRMLADQIDANQRMAARLKSMAGADGRLHGVLATCGLEWLERGYPELSVRGAPISFSAGVTLREQDAEYLRGLLNDGRGRLVAQRAWELWPASIRKLLDTEFRVESVSGRDVMYRPRGRPSPPVAPADPTAIPADAYRDAAGSNVQILSTRYSAGMDLQSGPGFGATRDTNWCWPFGTFAAEGKAIAKLRDDATAGGTVIFRILSGDNGILAWEEPVVLTPERREVVLPVSVQTEGRSVWLQTELPADHKGQFFAGWREMRITHTNAQDRTTPPPFGRGLATIWPVAPEAIADQVWYGRSGRFLASDGAATLPAENWRRDTQVSGKLTVTAELTPDPALAGDHVVVTLAWYRGSRFEIMTEREVDLRTEPRVTMEAYVPEPGGWVGLLVRTGTAQHQVRVVGWGR